MNQTCKVCGEPAAGFHFGAFTCEGCKSFFGRSYNNVSSITECKNNNECVINKKNRTACKACRLRKCLLVGMSKSGSRYGRRSNWFKIHCLLQEQQQQAAAVAAAAAAAVHGNHHNGRKTSTPPATSLSMLGHTGGYPPGIYSPLGSLEDFKHPAPSPSVSSPDSHNSDSSIDINVRSNALLRQNKTLDSIPTMNKELFLPLPFPTLPSISVMPPPGFLPPTHLLFSGYHSLYSHHQGLLKPVAEHHQQTNQHSPMNSQHLSNNNSRYTPNHNNKNNNCISNININNNHIINNGNKAAEELTKRFYFDAVLKSQKRSPGATTMTTSVTNTTPSINIDVCAINQSDDEDENNIDNYDIGIGNKISKKLSPIIQTNISQAIITTTTITTTTTTTTSSSGSILTTSSIQQENPIDLSIKINSSSDNSNSSSKSSIVTVDDNRQLSGGESDPLSEEDDDDTTTITTAIRRRLPYTTANLSDEESEYSKSMKRIKIQIPTAPLDLTTKV